MKKAFISDFDGTLHFVQDGQGYISKKDISAIAHWKQLGHGFGICTGRPKQPLLNDLGALNIDYLVCSSGSHICQGTSNAYQDEWIGEIHGQLMLDLFERFHQMGDFYIHADGVVYTFQHGPAYPKQVILNQPQDILLHQVVGLSIGTGDEKIAQQLTQAINQEYSTLSAYQNTSYLDVIGHGVSKGTGAKHIKEKYQVELVAGMGDSFNDIPLLQACDIAFTFAHAPKQVQQYADHIVESVAEALCIMGQK